MTNEHCLTVRAAGASPKIREPSGGPIERKVGTKFCFEEAKAKQAFAIACDSLDIACQDG